MVRMGGGIRGKDNQGGERTRLERKDRCSVDKRDFSFDWHSPSLLATPGMKNQRFVKHTSSWLRSTILTRTPMEG